MLSDTDLSGTYKDFGFKFTPQTLKLLAKLFQEKNLMKDKIEIEEEAFKNSTEYNYGEDKEEAAQANAKDHRADEKKSEAKAKEFKQVVDQFIKTQRNFMFGQSLSNVDVKEFLGFVDILQGQDLNFVRNNFDFEDVDWNQLVNNFIQKLSSKDKEDRRPLTELSKPLL